jgi:glycosyl hydrolase 38 domain protein
MDNAEPRIPGNELEQYLNTLPDALTQAMRLTGKQVTFHGLPIEEWAGPAYAAAALFDPFILTAELPELQIRLDAAEGELRSSRKEAIRFRTRAGREACYRLPMLWGGVPFRILSADGGRREIATVGEFPGCLVRPGEALFAFHPLRVLHRYLNMAQPETTWDFTDLLVRAILAAGGCDSSLDDNMLRRDFHALGINCVLMIQLGICAANRFHASPLPPLLAEAARAYRANDSGTVRRVLRECFRHLAAERRRIVGREVYFMNLPHGGIQLEHEGYAEYDSPEESARVLNLYLDWQEKYNYRFALDVGVGTLQNFARTNPRTFQRIRRAVRAGTVEPVNGSYSQPYGHLFPEWDNRRQFERGQEILEQLFGKRAVTFASQEIALHPKLPDILADNGFRYALHRSQNLGLAPIDSDALVDWVGPDGKSVRTLPSHPLRTERRGAEIYRHLGVLLASERNGSLPFIAFTNFIDQSFVDLYMEEVVRSNEYAEVWGKFVTPSEFFAATAELPALPKRYRLDEYRYALGFSGGGIHGHQTGGLSTKHVFLGQEARNLQKGGCVPSELDVFLTRQAHDCYLVPYFAAGSFMEGGLTDYNGPRYRFENDRPRGIGRFLCDAVGYPDTCADVPEAVPERAEWDGAMLRSGGHAVPIDPVTGVVKGQYGRLHANGLPFTALRSEFADNRLLLAGTLPSFGAVRLIYFISGGILYGVAERLDSLRQWDMNAIEWADAVCLRHSREPGQAILRTVCSVTEPTELEYFHSLAELTVGDVRFVHGGNIFFRQSENYVENRLWCYGEFSRSFYWGMSL